MHRDVGDGGSTDREEIGGRGGYVEVIVLGRATLSGMESSGEVRSRDERSGRSIEQSYVQPETLDKILQYGPHLLFPTLRT